MAENELLSKVRIAVVGAGIFGTTAAIKLAEEGFSVTLFEKADEVMTAASGINQYRMHRGYHYPRSSDTIQSCQKTTPLFEAEYSDAIISNLRHYYAIAQEQSVVDGLQYLNILNEHQLPNTLVTPQHINASAVELVVEVEENLYDPYKLKDLVTKRIAQTGVTTVFNSQVSINDLSDFDYVIVATYASLNTALGSRDEDKREYQFEVCEKIVIEIPEELKGISTVIMDGPFMSFDPLGDTGYAVMGHVQHAIHKQSFGREAEVPDTIKPLLNRGIIKQPPVSNAQLFLEHGAMFMPALSAAKHVGSMYTIRTVLPRVDATDTRPTMVNAIDDKIITIYSGKVGNSVQAALDAIAIIKSRL